MPPAYSWSNPPRRSWWTILPHRQWERGWHDRDRAALVESGRETWDVAFAEDSPGIRMLHCDVPLHASIGMTLIVSSAGVWTQYTMGTASGNVPE